MTVTSTGACATLVDGGRTLVNNGQLVFPGGSILCVGNALIRNAGTLTMQGDGAGGWYSAVLYGSGGAGQVVNTGRIEKTGGSGTALIGYQLGLDNAGTIAAGAGTLSIGGGNPAAGATDTGGYTIAAGATLDFSGGTRALGAGSSITGGGTLSVSGGTFDMSHLTAQVGALQASATLQQTLSGTTPGSGFGQIAVSGAANISQSTLQIQAAAGYCAQLSDTYRMLTFGSRDGPFHSVVLNQPNGQTFSVSYGAGYADIGVDSGNCDTTPPTVDSAQLDTNGKPSDQLLHRALSYSASDVGRGVWYVEYGWTQGSVAAGPTSPIRDAYGSSGITNVDYSPTQPDQQYKLLIRAVDWAGNKSSWTAATGSDGTTTIVAPPPPVVVALGDSITAGHNKQGNLAPTVCYDSIYGYPWYAYQDVLSTVHSAGWTAGYYNFARSGFDTEQVINGDGLDACNDEYLANGGTTNPLQDAANVLAAHAGSWNRVLITGGIDNTNWTAILATIGKHSALGANLFYTATDCQADLDSWNGWDVGSNRSSTTFIKDVHLIATTLNAADPVARVLWVSYYNFAGTGNIGAGTPAPGACSGPFDQAIQALQGQIDTGLAGTTVQDAPVNIGTADITDPGIQSWYPSDTLGGLEGASGGNVPGWPHPNSDGAKSIADGLILG